jgi:hypothetical protein
MSYDHEPIMSILARILEGDYVLPSIQRDFVWEPEKMYKLMDSIFRGYPFSTFLFWNTKQRLQYREFIKEWDNSHKPAWMIKDKGKKGTMVLDGQQRLQTLYLAVYGTYEQKQLYFNILSGTEPEDTSQPKYQFRFIAGMEAERLNQANNGIEYWIPFSDVAKIISDDITSKANYYSSLIEVSQPSDANIRISTNLMRTYFVMRGDDKINYYLIDRDYGDEGGKVTDLDQVLEIFVRVNSGGEVLSKSDLMFSLMIMSWDEGPILISDLIEDLNRMGRYEFTKDFILKCALVCCKLGAKYDVNKFRDEKTINTIKDNFGKITLALLNCMQFVTAQARFLDDRILRSYNSLIPFVYFYYIQPDQQVRGEETLLRIKQAVYLALMTSVYSRFADNYIDQTAHNILDVAHVSRPGVFPLEAYIHFVLEKTGYNWLSDELLQANINLLMNILEGGTRLPEGKRTKHPEVDHIFPQSKLSSRGIDEEHINNFANLRLISQPDNNWKRAQDPKPYFDKNPGAATRYLIPVDTLEYEQYSMFLDKRRALIWEHLQRFLGLAGHQQAIYDASSAGTPVIPTSLPEPSNHVSDLRLACQERLTAEEQAHPILQDHTNWLDVYRQLGYEPRWCGRYYWALHHAGIQNVADFAAAVMALKLQANGRSSGQPMYQFANALPDGSKLTIVTREFGGYAWKSALEELMKRGLDIEKYFIG